MYRREVHAVSTGDAGLSTIVYVMNDDHVGLPTHYLFGAIPLEADPA